MQVLKLGQQETPWPHSHSAAASEEQAPYLPTGGNQALEFE